MGPERLSEHLIVIHGGLRWRYLILLLLSWIVYMIPRLKCWRRHLIVWSLGRTDFNSSDVLLLIPFSKVVAVHSHQFQVV